MPTSTKGAFRLGFNNGFGGAPILGGVVLWKKRLAKSEWGLLHRRKTTLDFKVHAHCDCYYDRHSVVTANAPRNTFMQIFRVGRGK